MCRLMFRCAMLLLSTGLSESVTWGQFGGSRAGVESNSEGVSNLPMLDREVVEGVTGEVARPASR